MNKYNQILRLLQNLSDEQINELLNSQTIDLKDKTDNTLNIENLLKELCVNPWINGFKYLKDAINICLEDEAMLRGVTKTLYPKIAEHHNTTPTRVERAIRHAIETSWGKVDEETYHQIFYNEFDKPTNSKYIAYICSYIKNIKVTTDLQPQKLYR